MEETKTTEKQKYIANLLGLNSWSEADTDLYPIARLLDLYLSDNGIRHASLYAKMLEQEDVYLPELQDRHTKNFYVEYKAKNNITDGIARHFYEQNNSNYGFVSQVVETLGRIKDLYFPNEELYTATEVMGIINNEVFDHDNLFAFSDGVDLEEKIDIYEGMKKMLEKSIDPAAVMMSIDSLREVPDGDGREFYEYNENKAIMAMLKLRNGKNKIPEETIEDLFGSYKSDIKPAALKLVEMNFTAGEIEEFINTGKISDRDTYMSQEYKNTQRKSAAIVFRIFENDFFNKNIFTRRNSAKLGNMSDEDREMYESTYEFLKSKMIEDLMRKKDIKKIPGSHLHYLTNKNTTKKVVNENDEYDHILVSVAEDVIRKLKSVISNETEKLSEIEDQAKAAKMDARITALETLMEELIKMRSKKGFFYILTSGGPSFKSEDARQMIINQYSKDEIIQQEIKRKARNEKDAAALEKELHAAHTNYLIKLAEYREASKPQTLLKENVGAYITREKIAEIAQKHKGKLIEFEYLNIQDMEENGLFSKAINDREIITMLPISIFKDKQKYAKDGIPFESGEHEVVMAKPGAFVRIELEGNKVKSDTVQIMNPEENGKIIGCRPTQKGILTINNHWSDEVDIKKIEKPREEKIKVKYTKLY